MSVCIAQAEPSDGPCTLFGLEPHSCAIQEADHESRHTCMCGKEFGTAAKCVMPYVEIRGVTAECRSCGASFTGESPADAGRFADRHFEAWSAR